MSLTPDFERTAMCDGARFEGPTGEVWTNEVRRVGELNFESGKVLVSDGFVADFETDPALERTVPPGPHAVYVAEAGPGDSRDIIAAWVEFSDRDIASWTPAFYEGYEPDDVYEPGFGVDSGTACIADRAAAARVNDEASQERLLAEFTAESSRGCHAQFHPECGDFFICTSGIGDGFYTSFWGNDGDGEPAILMVDFGRLRVPVYETTEVELPLRRGKVVARLERAGVTVRTTWLPLFGPRKLVALGGSLRVREMTDAGPEVVQADWSGFMPVYPLRGVGSRVEIGAIVGYQSAEPIGDEA